MGRLADRYNFSQIADKCRQRWEAERVYKFSSQCGDVFSIDTPPPTISGSLHIGHVFSYCHTDFIARYQRMRGKNVFYAMGFDNNGLPTERLVEKSQKVKASTSDKKEFVELCESVSKRKIHEFRDLFDSIGLSVDWDFAYQTNSEECKRLSQESFLRLYKKGLIYRKKMPVLWDVIDQTATAQAEIEEKEFDSHMNYIVFSYEDSKGEVDTEKKRENVVTESTFLDSKGVENSWKLEVATTRPELLSACVALLYNPSDERYKGLEGKYAITPIFYDRVPIIADPDVVIEKGTGLVMCCTFGDEMDIKWWQKYNLPLREAVDRYGKINALGGRKVEDARESILEKLKSEGRLVRQEKITHSVKCAERSGGKLEIISTDQWYISVLAHKEELKSKVREVEWLPEKMRIKIDQWIDGIKWDWCISRQRYLGVRVPVYHDQITGEILLPDSSELPVEGNTIVKNGRKYVQDTDVLDTWATSSLTPQINSSMMRKKPYSFDDASPVVSKIEADVQPVSEKYLTFQPMSLRPQAHEIIRTWAFYTILRSYLEYGTVPWERIMISGWCLASDKSKMSKSKGNTIDPVRLIAEYGADVVRYWSASAGLGCDTCFSENVLSIGRKLVNKLWNAARLVEHFLVSKPEVARVDYPTDLWILSRLSEVIVGVGCALEKCDYFSAKNLLERFFLHEYCDNYLELVKSRAYKEVPGQESVLHSLSLSFALILKLFAPFLPYVTDEIYSVLFPDDGSVHSRGKWPNEIQLNRKITFSGDDLIKILTKVREFKSEQSISIRKEISLLEIKTASKDMVEAEYDIRAATNSASIKWEMSNISMDLEVKVSL